MSVFNITCPHCKTQFEPGESMREDIQKELRMQMADWKKKQETEYQQRLQQKDESVQQLLSQEKQKLQESISKTMAEDYGNRLKIAQDALLNNEEKLKEARKKELEFLQKEQALMNREADMQITLQKQLMEEREKLKEQVSREETEKRAVREQEYQLRMREMEKQIEDQKRLVDEMKRKAEQGSMQLQGEVQELLLEALLQAAFPFDRIEPVGKGVRGADCIQVVCNQFGGEAGKIIYESKRTKDFSLEWIEKLKTDMRSLGADVAVIVTQSLPKDMERFGEKDGVYICTFAEVRSVAVLLRQSILKISLVRGTQERKGDKMTMLYDYLTGNEFNEQWKAIREGFLGMRLSIQRERDAMEKLWKAREKQLEKVLLSAAHIRGSIEGIAGADVNLNLLEGGEEELE